jgi:phosphatidylglycerophosphate synthase
MSTTSAKPVVRVATIGNNPTCLWGLTSAERTARIARMWGLGEAGAEPGGEGAEVLVHAGFAWDPVWLLHLAASPGLIVTSGGVPVLAHARDAADALQVRAAMEANAPLVAEMPSVAFESGPTVENKKLRKRETPFLAALTPDNVRSLERASYFGAYKGATDVLTKYLWPEWALAITRFAARFGISPNMITLVGAILCVSATVLFARGDYWLGMALGLGFMVLDTADGKLARCTITSSWWGNIFDHGIDLIHPPFWWWFWATGLAHYAGGTLAYDDATFWWVQAAIQGGYVVQRLIEGTFVRLYEGFHIHVWRKFDSQFRLITARRNPNMVILFVSMWFARPDLGLIAVAWWTVISCAVHAVRLVQALAAPKPIVSWLSGEAA